MSLVVIRGFLNRAPVFREDYDDDPADSVVAKHLRMFNTGAIDMIELEFPDLPERSRYLRFGLNPAGMVRPLLVI